VIAPVPAVVALRRAAARVPPIPPPPRLTSEELHAGAALPLAASAAAGAPGGNGDGTTAGPLTAAFVVQTMGQRVLALVGVWPSSHGRGGDSKVSSVVSYIAH